MNSQEVGQITDYSIKDFKLILKAKIDSKVKIPLNSDFYSLRNLFNNVPEEILIRPSSENLFYKNNDTIKTYHLEILEGNLRKIEGDTLEAFKEVLDSVIIDYPKIIEEAAHSDNP